MWGHMTEKLTTARPYAKAIFELALNEESFSTWSAMLALLCFIAEDKRVKRKLRDITLDPHQLSDFFLSVAVGRLNEQGENLLKILALRRRLILLPEIKSLFERYRASARNTLQVQCTTMIPLSETQKQHFIEALSKRFKRTVTMECEVDPTLIGGFLLKAGDTDTVIDGSVRGQLMQLKETMGR